MRVVAVRNFLKEERIAENAENTDAHKAVFIALAGLHIFSMMPSWPWFTIPCLSCNRAPLDLNRSGLIAISIMWSLLVRCKFGRRSIQSSWCGILQIYD